MRIRSGKLFRATLVILLAKINCVKRFETRQLSIWDACSLTKFALRLELTLPVNGPTGREKMAFGDVAEWLKAAVC